MAVDEVVKVGGRDTRGRQLLRHCCVRRGQNLPGDDVLDFPVRGCANWPKKRLCK